MLEMGAIFGGSFTLALSGALMPGPLFTVAVSESTRHGFKTGPLLMTGHAILELVLVLAIIHGLDSFLKSSTVVGAISLLGGSLLIYLAIDMIKVARGMTLNAEVSGSARGSAASLIVTGILTSLSNPYWTLWWATIGLGYLVAAMKYGALGIAVFFLGHISGDFAWYSLVSFGISRGKRFLGDAGYRVLVKCCGWFLLFFGGWFLVSAGKCLFGRA